MAETTEMSTDDTGASASSLSTLYLVVFPFIKLFTFARYLITLIYWLMIERFSKIGKLAHRLEVLSYEESQLRTRYEQLNESYRKEMSQIVERRQQLIDLRVEVIEQLAKAGLGEDFVASNCCSSSNNKYPTKTECFEDVRELEPPPLPRTPTKHNVANISQLFEDKLNPFKSRQQLSPSIKLDSRRPSLSSESRVTSPSDVSTCKRRNNRKNLSIQIPPPTPTPSSPFSSSPLPSPSPLDTSEAKALKSSPSKKIKIRRQSSQELLSSANATVSMITTATSVTLPSHGSGLFARVNEHFESLVVAVLAEFRGADNHRLAISIKELYDQSPEWRTMIDELRRQFALFSYL